MLVLLFLLSASNAALNCPKYQCKHDDLGFYLQQCLYFQQQTYYVQPCSSKVVSYCQPTSAFSNITCTQPPKLPFKGIAWPGESCFNDTSCAYGVCDNAICNSANFNNSCSVDDQCNPGLYCFSGICSFQLQIGQLGCTSDTDCTNNAGCLMNSNGVGTCTPYYSIPAGTLIPGCNNNVNTMCESGLCGSKNGQNYCAQSVSSAKALPYSCMQDTDCTSNPDTFLSMTFTSKCQCSYSPTGQSFCGLFPGDAPYQNYINSLKTWFNSTYVLQCNANRRTNPSCIHTYMDTQEAIALNYNISLAQYYPLIQQNDNCTQYVYNQAYWELFRNFTNPPSDDSAFHLIISTILYLFF